MRLFLGIPMSDTVVHELAAIRARLEKPADGLRWSAPESWHVTLQFLGAATAEQYECVLAQLRAADAKPAQVQLEGLGFFERSGVFFAGIHLTPELSLLQMKIVAGTSRCGFEAESRPYHPHITLARNKGRENGVRALKPRVGTAPEFSAFTAHEYLLYESFPNSTGSRYEVRARFPLTK
ncbi:MAG TPA: RNA 2',3'-cyclic phosphodiesterase [Terracidiphilus sp.]|jgi:2'-5' RNA ligase|nr:RNA 2',3'-cyclic phosphodiesterase [Terracidiphilus sp.]